VFQSFHAPGLTESEKYHPMLLTRLLKTNNTKIKRPHNEIETAPRPSTMKREIWTGQRETNVKRSSDSIHFNPFQRSIASRLKNVQLSQQNVPQSQLTISHLQK
jgi:hypothetical protein